MMKPTLLLVEDNEDGRKSLRMLMDAKFVVVAVGTMADAKHAVEVMHIDAVLLDLVLPDSTPQETLSAMKIVCPDVPVIVHSGADVESQVIRGGAQDFILKGSMTADEIGDVIIRAIKRHELRRDKDYQLVHSMINDARDLISSKPKEGI